MSNLLRTLGQAVLDGKGKSVDEEMHGVPVLYRDSTLKKSMWGEWEGVLEEWLPKFEDAGWLEGLSAIKIGDEFPQGPNAQGQYDHERECICFPRDPEYVGQPWLVGETKEYALIHELTHHVHIREVFDRPAPEVSLSEINRQQDRLGFRTKQGHFERAVSEYAGQNFLEAVAETCAGITLGRDYSKRTFRKYQELGGPEPIQNWEEPETGTTTTAFESISEYTEVVRQNHTGSWQNETIKYKKKRDQ